MTNFALWIGIGAALGLLGVARSAPSAVRSGQAHDDLDARLDGGLWALFAALLGARALFAAENWPAYAASPLRALAVWEGGLSAGGALLGGTLALGVYALVRRLPLGALADSLLPLAAALAVTVPLAAWSAGSAYGAPSEAFWAVPGPDEWGAVERRVPVQLAAAGLGLLGFLSLDLARRRLRVPGTAGTLTLALLSGLVLGVSLLRADPALYWSGQRPDTWAALIGLGGSLIAGLMLRLSQPVRPAEQSNSADKAGI